MKPYAFNGGGNSYPEGTPVYKIRLLLDTHYAKDSVLPVMNSENPFFRDHWRLSDTDFILKQRAEVVDPETPLKYIPRPRPK